MSTQNIKTVELNVSGMTCGSCRRHVEEALKQVSGVAAVTVDLGNRSASVTTTDAIDTGALVSAVEDAGYGATIREAQAAV